MQISIYVSFIQIYNEKIYDLLQVWYFNGYSKKFTPSFSFPFLKDHTKPVPLAIRENKE